jgi:hypothetical protein
MKTYIIVSFFICLVILVGCGPAENRPATREQSGFNGGEGGGLRLVEERSFDVAEICGGELYGVRTFDIDAEGNMLLYDRKVKQIFKCSAAGELLTKIGKRGHGPGEYEIVSNIQAMGNGEVVICDPINGKFVFYGPDGAVLREKKFTFRVSDGVLLRNGNYLFKKMEMPEGPVFHHVVVLTDGEFNTIKELHRQPTFNPMAPKIKGILFNFSCPVAGERIYIADQVTGYEINVFDLLGNRLHKITKSFTPVGPNDAYKEFFISTIPPRVKEFVKAKLFFPEHLPPFHDIVLADGGRLLVITYEQSEKENHFFVDVFDRKGEYMGRQALHLPILSTEFRIIGRNDRLYIVAPGADDSIRLSTYKIL